LRLDTVCLTKPKSMSEDLPTFNLDIQHENEEQEGRDMQKNNGPSDQVIRNIMNYSKSLFVFTTTGAQVFSTVLS
jgi:hypothetical protein